MHNKLAENMKRMLLATSRCVTNKQVADIFANIRDENICVMHI